MNILSVREHPEIRDEAIRYIQSKWANEDNLMVYEDCIAHSVATEGPLPQWYLLESGGEWIGCAGIIPNDFISRMDLWPWLCALYIEEGHRGHSYGSLLLGRAKDDAKKAGYSRLYLATDHIGYYEKYGFTYIGNGYHPWGDESRVYEAEL